MVFCWVIYLKFTLKDNPQSSLQLTENCYITSTDVLIGVCSWTLPVSLVGGGFSVTVPTDAVLGGSVWGSVTIPIAFRIEGTGTIALGGTCFTISVKLSVNFSAEKNQINNRRQKYNNQKTSKKYEQTQYKKLDSEALLVT